MASLPVYYFSIQSSFTLNPKDAAPATPAAPGRPKQSATKVGRRLSARVGEFFKSNKPKDKEAAPTKVDENPPKIDEPAPVAPLENPAADGETKAPAAEAKPTETPAAASVPEVYLLARFMVHAVHYFKFQPSKPVEPAPAATAVVAAAA